MVGLFTGTDLARMRGMVPMQTSGFATLPNTPALLTVLFQMPLLMQVSERDRSRIRIRFMDAIKAQARGYLISPSRRASS